MSDLRNRAAKELRDTLMLFGRYDNVSVDEDRVTYLLHGEDAVTLLVVNAQPIVAPRADGSCPFCGSTRSMQVKEADDTFEAQRGCLDCDKWIDPVRLRK